MKILLEWNTVRSIQDNSVLLYNCFEMKLTKSNHSQKFLTGSFDKNIGNLVRHNILLNGFKSWTVQDEPQDSESEFKTLRAWEVDFIFCQILDPEITVS